MATRSIDTNIFVYSVDRTAGDKRLIAIDVITAAVAANTILTQQV